MKKSRVPKAFALHSNYGVPKRTFALTIASLMVVSCASIPTVSSDYFAASKPSGMPEYGDYLAARYAGLVRDGSAAAQYYSQALKNTPNDESLLERAIIYALVAGDSKQALKLAKRSDVDVQTGAMAETLLMVDAFSRGKYKKTVEFKSDAVLGVMQNVVARSIREWSQIGLRNKNSMIPISYSGNESKLFRGIRLYSDGLLQLAEKQDAVALESLQKAWDLGGRYPVGVNALARLQAEMGDLDAARETVDKFYEEIGDNPLIDSVDADLRKNKDILAPRLSPNEGAAASILGYALAVAAKQGGDIANLYYSIVLMFDPNQDAARLLLADSMRGAERLDAAVEQLQFIGDDSVYYGAARAREAWVFYDLEEKDTAVSLAKTALETKPGRSLKMQVGDLYRTLEMFEEAEQLFDAVVLSDISEGFVDWRVLFARAGMRDKLSRWTEAEADLLAALSYAPDHPEILNYLGYSWVDRGMNIDKAFSMIQSAMEQRPNEGYIRDSLGWAYYRLSHYEKAVQHLEDAAALDPADPVINDHLGDAYWRVGRQRQAKYQWKRVVDFSVDQKLKNSAAEKLALGLDAQLTQLLPVQ